MLLVRGFPREPHGVQQADFTDSGESVGSIVVRWLPTILSMASANVRTLQPQELLKTRRAGLALNARMMFMDHQFHDAGFSLVFVQESCIAEASLRQQPHIATYSSASTDAGQKLTPIAVSPRLLVVLVDSPKLATWPAFVVMLPLPVLLSCSVGSFGMPWGCNSTNSPVLAPSSVLMAMPSWDRRPLVCSRHMRSHRSNPAMANPFGCCQKIVTLVPSPLNGQVRCWNRLPLGGHRDVWIEGVATGQTTSSRRHRGTVS